MSDDLLERALAAHDELLAAEGAAATIRERRDALIAATVAGDTTKYRLAAVLGISQTAVTKIIDRHDQRVSG